MSTHRPSADPPGRPGAAPGGRGPHHALILVLGGLLAVPLPSPAAAQAREPTADHAAPEADGPMGGVPAPSDTLPVDPAVRIGELANGLRYYVRVNDRPEARAELRLVVNAGSVLEDDDQRGLAHFVEHMAFNGTERFERQALVDYLESVGMRFGPHVNAYTSFDETVYMLKVPTDSAGVLETALDILEDWAGAVSFDPGEVEKERGVVIEEWRLGLGAEERMNQELLPVLFRGSRYAERLPIGTRESLETFDRDELVRFYGDWYRPDLMAVVAVGDFDPERVERLIRERFADLASPESARPRPLYEVPGHHETLYEVATDPEATSTAVRVYHKRPLRPFETVADYRRRILVRLYTGMLNRRLFEITRRPDAPFVAAGTGQGTFVRSMETGFLAALAPEGGARRALEALATESRRVREHGFVASELEREKASLLRALERLYDEREKRESDAYAGEYLGHFLEGEPIPGIEAEYAFHRRFLPEIALEEVDALADEWLGEANRVVLASAPGPASDREPEGLGGETTDAAETGAAEAAEAEVTEAGGAGAAEAPAAGIPTDAGLAAALARAETAPVAAYEDVGAETPLVAHPPEPGVVTSVEAMAEIGVTVWELSNGVRVLLKPTDFKDDEVLLRAWSPGGTSLVVSDEEWEEVFAADAAVAQGGVGPYDLVGLQKALAGKAVGVSPSIGSLGEGISGQASPKDLETMFQLVWLWFTDPNKDPDAFRVFQQQVSAVLENRGADPRAAFQDTVQVTMADGHPRARPPSRELFAELDLDDSFEFYRDRFADASDFTFVLVGSFTLEEARPLVTRWLGSLPGLDRVERWRDLDIDPPPGIVRKTVRKGVEPQSQTRIAFTGPFEFTPPRRQEIHALADALQIRLREVLREDLGGTYSVDVSASPEKHPDPTYTLWISFGSDPGRVEELAGVVFEEIERFRSEGPSLEEVGKVREQARRAREENLRENGWWAANLLYRERNEEDPRELASFELIETIDATTIREAARRWLDPERYLLFRLLPEDAEAPAGSPAPPGSSAPAASPPPASSPPRTSSPTSASSAPAGSPSMPASGAAFRKSVKMGSAAVFPGSPIGAPLSNPTHTPTASSGV